MKKRELAKLIRDVMVGRHGHTWIMIWWNGGYCYSTGIGASPSPNVDPETGEHEFLIFKHCCNEMTCAEAERELTECLTFLKNYPY